MEIQVLVGLANEPDPYTRARRCDISFCNKPRKEIVLRVGMRIRVLLSSVFAKVKRKLRSGKIGELQCDTLQIECIGKQDKSM